MKEKLTISLINYLEQIYSLEQDNREVRVTDVANAIALSKASVNRAINILAEQGYVTHEHYGVICLTEKGIKVAEKTYESKEIVKKFLIEFLEVDEEIAIKESNQIGYILSKETRKKLKNYIKKIK